MNERGRVVGSTVKIGVAAVVACAAACGGAVEAVDYGAAVTIRGLVPAEAVDAFRARIFDLSGGAVTAAVTGQVRRPVPLG